MIKSKVLKSATIISKDLYVERNADRQIRRVIDEMGRPGYILVARQLGKTNLLLHTKQVLENDRAAIVYIDLSNLFENERDCFRNIIDTAIETHTDFFHDASGKIHNMRLSEKLPPQKEHEKELRVLLSYIPEKLIIFLDEIDALTNTSYSNKIFAQIRSIYFTRINYTEYEKLTYVLSGVLEPSEIINDKNISPFNIGEKIYLDDFTHEEYLNFVEKTKLSLDGTVSERVYYWTAGNPRMTWDLCSELENLVLENETLNEESVDNAVHKIYLKDFDTPPVDHIRDRVEREKDLRDAVQVVNYGKGRELDDRIKRKLYLAGIISSNFDDETITIKNEVLNRSLTDQWIREIEKKYKSLEDLAKEKYQEEKYEECISLFQELFEGDDEISNKALCFYYLGKCYFELEKYEEASKCFKKKPFNKKKFSHYYYLELYNLGLCSIYTKDYESSIKCFTELIENEDSNEHSLESKLNISAVYGTVDFKKYKDDIFSLNKSVIDTLEKDSEKYDKSELNNLSVTAYYNLGSLYYDTKDFTNSKLNLTKSLDICSVSCKPRILFKLHSFDDNPESRTKTLNELVNSIIDNNLTLQSNYSITKPLNLSEALLYNILWEVFSEDSKDLFTNILDYCLEHIYPELKPYEIFYSLASFLVSSKRTQEAERVFVELFNRFEAENAGSEFIIGCYKFSCILFDLPEYKNKYFSLFENNLPESFNLDDLYIFNGEINELVKNKKYDKALQLIDIADNYYDTFEDKDKINYLLTHYHKFVAYHNSKQVDKALEQARSLLERTSHVKSPFGKNHLLGMKEVENIREIVGNYIEHNAPKLPFTSGRLKIGRNDFVTVRYTDGRTINIKYKKVLRDIEKGLCSIVT